MLLAVYGLAQIADVRAAGADGIAIISAITQAADPIATAKQLWLASITMGLPYFGHPQGAPHNLGLTNLPRHVGQHFTRANSSKVLFPLRH